MKNLLNIDDQVKINIPGVVGNGAIATVQSMQKWPDGNILYIGAYHQDCPEGGEGYDTSIQFGEGQYELLNPTVSETSATQKVRCKFVVQSKKVYVKNDQCERPTTIDMYAVKGEPFGKYTPTGHIEMYIMNDEAEKQFEIGKEYFVDFTAAE